jgi:hypothetical protein
MTGKTLIALIVVAAGAAGAAYFIASHAGTTAPGSTVGAASAGSAFVPGLSDRINDIAEIRVKHANKPEDEFTVRRTDAGWIIPERGSFPAKFEKVKDAVVGLAELRYSEGLTSKPDKYPQLGVQDPATYVEPKDGEHASANIPTLMTIRDAKGAELASVIVGGVKYAQPPSTYVRKAGEAQAWLCTGQLNVPGQVSGWVDQEFLRISGNRVKSGKFVTPNSPELLVVKNAPADATWAVQNVPEGKHLRGTNMGDQVALALSSISLDDVAPIDTIDFDTKKNGKIVSTYEFRTFDGLVLAGSVVEQDSKSWLRVIASVDESAKAPDGATETKSLDDVKKEAADINERLGRYAFALPQWKIATFSTTLDSLLDASPPTPPPTMNDPGTKSLPIGAPGAQPSLPPLPSPMPAPPANKPGEETPKPDTSAGSGPPATALPPKHP